ncbi:MAG: iron-sulfur cluster assembly scaffold protein [Candidatus Moraniibacteriota bacterium]|nr:MAG: iron-sulfur cluster assembly scaffold protein [Candidatus Moranbacteria bacterium]
MSSNDLILDHYHHPRNSGSLQHATHHAETSNLSCGDSLAMDIIIKDDIIEEIGWTGNGCALSQASASVISEFIMGKSVSDMESLSKETVLSFLGIETLSPTRLRCALLSLETIKKTLEK